MKKLFLTMEPNQRINQPLKKMFLNNFLGGIAWGLGATVGISLLLAIIGLLIKQVNLVPIVGNFLSEVLDFVFQHNQNLRM